MNAEPWTLTARWIFPADAPPLLNGTITIQGDKIVAVDPAGVRTADEDLGNVAILPGLVNAHTHLDLSDARGKIPPGADFTQWLRGVIAHRRSQSELEVEEAIKAGIDESLDCGVTLLGDIAVEGKSEPLLRETSLRAIVFYELLGLSRNRIVSSVEAATSWFTKLGREELLSTINGIFTSPRVERMIRNKPTWLDEAIPSSRLDALSPGLSPHAPYSVNTWGFWLAANWNERVDLPIAVHLAEWEEEVGMLATHSGRLRDFLASLGAWEDRALAPSHDWIVGLFDRGKSVLWIHANYLGADTPLPAGHTIVYCPRTHAAFGHPPHPFRKFLKRGVRVVLGTDSLASNPDLDILAEARFVAARHPDLPGAALLRMIALDGAIALGWGDVAGSLTPGKSAELVVLPLPDREEQDPYRLVFESDQAVQRTLFRGEWRI